MGIGSKYMQQQGADVRLRDGNPMIDTGKPDTEQLTERIVFLAKDTPAEFLAQLEAIAAGDFAAVGLTASEDEQAD